MADVSNGLLMEALVQVRTLREELKQQRRSNAITQRRGVARRKKDREKLLKVKQEAAEEKRRIRATLKQRHEERCNALRLEIRELKSQLNYATRQLAKKTPTS